MDPPPGDADRGHPGGPRGLHVERRVTDVRGIRGRRAESLEPEQERLGARLVALGLVTADDDLEQAGQRQPGEGELDGRPAASPSPGRADVPRSFSVVSTSAIPPQNSSVSCSGSLCSR